jgi:hypothetical protein
LKINNKQIISLLVIVGGIGFYFFQSFLTDEMDSTIRTEEQCYSDFDNETETKACLDGVKDWNEMVMPYYRIRGFFLPSLIIVMAVIHFILYSKEGSQSYPNVEDEKK